MSMDWCIVWSPTFFDYGVCLHHHLQNGRTLLELAKQHGRQSVVDYLVNVGEYCIVSSAC